jgi:heme iron utilization protein
MNDAVEAPDAPNVLRTTDDEARGLARRLVRAARFAALAVLEPGTGHPLASRVATAIDIDGSPTLLVSALSGHTPALLADGRASLLFGEPGKGDPLAHPRITVIGRAERIARDGPDQERIRRRFLARHPKAQLYVDFADFAFFRLTVDRASLNGGFGKAYALAASDLVGGLDGLAEREPGAVDHMNADHADAIQLYATILAGAPAGAWRIASLDRDGLDLVDGDAMVRLDFPTPLAAPADLRPMVVAMAKDARAKAG